MSDLESLAQRLCTVQPGETWAVWADSAGLACACRHDAHLNLWATPIGHMSEADMAAREWKKVPVPAGWPVSER